MASAVRVLLEIDSCLITTATVVPGGLGDRDRPRPHERPGRAWVRRALRREFAKDSLRGGQVDDAVEKPRVWSYGGEPGGILGKGRSAWPRAQGRETTRGRCVGENHAPVGEFRAMSSSAGWELTFDNAAIRAGAAEPGATYRVGWSEAEQPRNPRGVVRASLRMRDGEVDVVGVERPRCLAKGVASK